MAQFGPDQLRKLALEAIEEAAAASHLGPVPRTRALALRALGLGTARQMMCYRSGHSRASGRRLAMNDCMIAVWR
jgi:hypothetical protein